MTRPKPASSIRAAGNSSAPVSLPTTTRVDGGVCGDVPGGLVVVVVLPGCFGGGMHGSVVSVDGSVVDELPSVDVVVEEHTVVVVVAHGSVVLLDEAVVDVEPSGAVVVVVSHGGGVVVVVVS